MKKGTTSNEHETREPWLKAAIDVGLRPWFEDHGYKVPTNIRAVLGFNSGGRKSKDSGETLPPEMSADGSFEIFISNAQDNPFTVLEVLTHQLVHAATGPEHKAAFGDCALSVGLVKEKSLKTTRAGPVLSKFLTSLAETLGPLPHAAVYHDRIQPKKIKVADRKAPQKGRGRKAECLAEIDGEPCGYHVTVNRLQVRRRGAPHCPIHGPMTVRFAPEDREEPTTDEAPKAPALEAAE